MKRTSSVYLATACVLAVGSCGRPSDSSTTSAGLSEWTIDPTPMVSIGEVSGDSNYLFSGIAAVRLLPDGQILVADRSTGTLRFFSAAGRFEHKMGGRGQGPGEFNYLSEVLLAAPDTILAFDGLSDRLTKFLMDGRVAQTVTFHAADGNPELYLGSFTDGSYALALIRQGLRDWSKISADVMEIGRFRPDGSMADQVTTDLGMRRLRHQPLPFSASFTAVMLGDTVFHMDGLRGRVKATGEAGTHLRTFRVTGAAWKLQDAFDSLEAALDSAGAERLEQLKGTAGLDTIPTVSDMLTGEDGHLWLKTYNPATDSYWVGRKRTGGQWIVVDTRGKPLAKVTAPKGFRLMEIRGQRVAGVAMDELGVERAEVFALHRG